MKTLPVNLCWKKGAGSLKILTGVLVHRVARPLRGSVSCGSGWSVPCVSIQLSLSQESGSGWSVPCVSIQLTLSQESENEVALFQARVLESPIASTLVFSFSLLS